MSDWTQMTATSLAQAIRDRQVSSVAVIDAHLAQIDRLNPKLNAICTLDRDNARARAKAADIALAAGENWGALHGVPITVIPNL